MESTKPVYVDIGANLLDERYTEGSYRGTPRHEPDLEEVLKRAQETGVSKLIITAGSLEESRCAIDKVRQLRQNADLSNLQLGCTVGVHPTRCSQEFLDNKNQLAPSNVLEQLKDLALDGQLDKTVVALGEIGLDYDRLEFSDKETQLSYLEQQLNVMDCLELNDLPLFLHNRNVGEDLLQVLQRHERRKKGVVHSFDDTLELAQKFIDYGLYIGLNGCSLKSEENLRVVRDLPLNRILLETDSPYCDIRNTHAGAQYVQTTWEKKPEKKYEAGKLVKGRNEPCQIVQVAEVIAGVKGITTEEVAKASYENSLHLFGWSA
eukprot:Nitzschia sp. Nitz4//scaffold367_size14546//5486//6445//NITZ4_008925-RA/size14546-processed-gene-0.9-mRNA-1//1//CDS//3329549324//8514//frame0